MRTCLNDMNITKDVDSSTSFSNINATTGIAALRVKSYCFYVPFCDTAGCDRSTHASPLDCPNCSTVAVAGLVLVQILLSITIIIGNAGIILVITRNKNFHNSLNMFKCSLAVADLSVGFIIPKSAYDTLDLILRPYDQDAINSTDYVVDPVGHKILPDTLCYRIYEAEHGITGLVMSIISVMSAMASIFHLVLLSIDRFVAVKFPIKYMQGRALTNKVAATLIAIVWILCVVLSVVLPIAMGPDHFTYGLTSAMMYVLRTVDPLTSLLYTVAALGLPYLALLGLNLATGVMLLKKSGKMKRRVSHSKMTRSRSKRSNEVTATVTIILLVLVFTITVMPALIIVSAYNGVDIEYYKSELYGKTHCALILLLVSNSAWNVMIYTWRNRNFRKAFKDLLINARKKCRRQQCMRLRSSSVAACQTREQQRRTSADPSANIKLMKVIAVQTRWNCLRDTSIGSCTMPNHGRLQHMASVTSFTSSTSELSYSDVGSVSTQLTNWDMPQCHSPTIMEEADLVFELNPGLPIRTNGKTEASPEKTEESIRAETDEAESIPNTTTASKVEEVILKVNGNQHLEGYPNETFVLSTGTQTKFHKRRNNHKHAATKHFQDHL